MALHYKLHCVGLLFKFLLYLIFISRLSCTPLSKRKIRGHHVLPSLHNCKPYFNENYKVWSELKDKLWLTFIIELTSIHCPANRLAMMLPRGHSGNNVDCNDLTPWVSDLNYGFCALVASERLHNCTMRSSSMFPGLLCLGSAANYIVLHLGKAGCSIAVWSRSGYKLVGRGIITS